jgi:hypothetical protein
MEKGVSIVGGDKAETPFFIDERYSEFMPEACIL